MGNHETIAEQDGMEESPKGNRRLVLLIFGGVLLVGVLVVAAFAGGQMFIGNKSQSQATPTASSLDPNEAMLSFAQCMRDNGLPDFPDPEGFGFSLGETEIDPDSLAFKSARETCKSLLPPPPAGSAASSLGPSEALLAFAQCMRDNGVPTFPDPVNGMIVDNARDLNFDTQKFEAAWKACESLRPQFPSGTSGDSAGNAGWEKVVPGGDCACADGSQFAFWVREADPDKVVFYLDGGGVCFDAETCAFSGDGENDFYNWSIRNEVPGLGGGIFDFTRADNPFSDYSFVYVPLCTGDSYLGDATHEYSPELTVQHKGFVNGTAALSYLAEHFPDASQVVVVGKTAGSVAAPVYGGLAADLLPDAQVTVFGAQSGAFPDIPDFNARIGELWGAYDTMPDWEVNEGLTARDWGTTRFWIQAGLHDPDIIMARFDYAFDPNAARAVESLTGADPSKLVELIDANEAAIEAAGVVLHSYTAPGKEHGIFDFEKFYEIEVNGVTLVDWIDALLAGEPLDDVHCDKCATE